MSAKRGTSSVHSSALTTTLFKGIRDVLRIILEYFGVPPDMLVPVWDSQLCGSYRSIVRMIGTNLPLAPFQRAYFQIPMLSNKPQGYTEFTMETAAIATFSDVLWVYEDEGDSFAKTRNHLPPRKEGAVNQNAAKPQVPSLKVGRHPKPKADPAALERITALESELLQLRAQIAMIITAAPGSGLVESQNAPGAAGMSPPPPACTSTTRCAAAPLPPPPPPPPPPPLCSGSSNATCVVLELIHQRKNDKDSTLKREETNGIPSMLDVLKDINKVKLRPLKRSPGGSLVRRRSCKGLSASLCDPAALIAEALKRKFAHHHLNDSSDKENSFNFSPFCSPETPKVPQQTRRSQGRRLI